MDEYKTFASIEGKKTDLQIAALITSCSRIVQDFIGYPLEASGALSKNIQAATGVQSYMLPGVDLIVDSITYIPKGFEESTGIPLKPQEFLVSETGRLDLLNVAPVQGDTFKVAYRIQGTDLESIKLATMLLVKYYYKEEFNKSSITAGGQTVSYQTGKNFPPQVRAILMMYRML